MSDSRAVVPQAFLSLLREWGKDFSLTQGLGGNCSVKLGSTMLVKASGKRLGDVSKPDYFYEVGLRNDEYFELRHDQPGKPSIEVFLHALLPQKYILHLHSTYGVAASLMAKIDSKLRESLTERGIETVSYRRPGLDLMNEIKRITQNHHVDSLLLENHGVVFGSNSIDGLRLKVIDFERLAIDALGAKKEDLILPSNVARNFSEDSAQHITWHLKNTWRISPDHVVFLGAEPPQGLYQCLKSATNPRDLLAAIGESESSISPRGEQLLWYLNVVLLLPKVELSTIGRKEAGALISWDAEKHRVQQSFIEKSEI